jgi:hypothetical protein
MVFVTPDDGQRNCPKHVEFYSKNKIEKLVHLVGFIIRIYQDERSAERQIRFFFQRDFLKEVSMKYKLTDCPLTSNTLVMFGNIIPCYSYLIITSP